MKQADSGEMHLQAKECQGLLAASPQKPAERHGMYVFSLGASRRNQPLNQPSSFYFMRE